MKLATVAAPKSRKSALTDAAIRLRAKPRDKAFKMAAGRGLYLFVTPSGGKSWRFNYSYGPKGQRKQKTIVLGTWPEMDVAAAEEARNAAKRHLTDGRDPGRSGVTDGMATFKEVGQAWLRSKRGVWSAKYAAIVETRLEADIFPAFGQTPIGAVRKTDILAALAAVHAPRAEKGRGAVDTAHRLLDYVGGVFQFSDDDRVVDITQGLRGKIPAKPETKNFKRLRLHELGPFQHRLDSAHCEPLTREAIRLTMYTAARTNEIIGARYEEFERLAFPEEAMWRIPKERMKGKPDKRREHQIYLSKQALACVERIRKLSGDGEYLFPKADARPGTMSNNSMLFALYGMGYRNKATIHGLRAAFSTIANESGLWEPEWIETQLAHAVGNSVSRAYNAAQYKPQRRELLQWWADKLDELKENERFGITEILR